VRVASNPVVLSVPSALAKASPGDRWGAVVVVAAGPGELADVVVQAATPRQAATRIPTTATRLLFTEGLLEGS
jgi:hypothetical protein